jgi:hypothetical protein
VPLQGVPSLFGGQRVAAGFTPFSKGWDFRATSGFVTDIAPNTYDVGDLYPTTRNGVTFGWGGAAGIDARNRNASADPRLAGIVFRSNDGNVNTWQLDLPSAGTYNINLALGDAEGGNPQNNYFQLLDNTTSKILFNPVATGVNTFADAAGNLWTSANWPANNVAASVVFATTTLIFKNGGTVDTASSCIAHLLVTRTA